MSTVHIEKKDRNAIDEAARTLKARLVGMEGKALRAAEASTLSGLPLDMAESALLALHGDHPARLDVDAQGQITVTFTSLRRHRDGGWLARSWTAIHRRLGPKLLAVRQFVEDKIIFLLMPALLLLLSANMAGLVAPLYLDFPGAGFLRVFPGMFLLLLVGLTAISALLALIFMVFTAAGLLFVAMGAVVVAASIYIIFFDGNPGGGGVALIGGALMLGLGWGWAKSGLEAIEALSNRKKDGVFAGVWLALCEFVFGVRRVTAPPAQDELSDERRLTALIQEKRGVLVVRDLVTLFGWDLREAEGALTRVLLDYGGDIEVTEDGYFRYMFPAWQSHVAAKSSTSFAPCWETMPSSPGYWGSETSSDWAVGSFLGAGVLGLLICQLVFAPVEFLFPKAVINIDDHVAASLVIGLGLWPYLAIAAVLGMRWAAWAVRRARHRTQVTRLDGIRRVVSEAESGGWHIDAKFAASFGGELDEEMGVKDGAYFFRFDVLRDHGARQRS